MYIKSVKLTLVVILTTFITLIPVIHADKLPGNWPPPDTPPPPVASWTALVDKSKLPKAPVKTLPYTCDTKDPWCSWTCTGCTRPQMDFLSCPNKTDWALTYDDGPGPNTEMVLNALASKGVKATFFVTGSRVFEHSEILKKVVNAGHQIGVHTWSHTLLTTQSNEEVIAEIKWTETVIKNVTGLTPKWMRPPGGDIDDRVRGILTQLGYKVAIWNRDSFDWKSNGDPTFNLDWVTGNFSQWVRNVTTVGIISLQHDLFNKTSAKIPETLNIVVNAGFQVKQVSNCLGDTRPYVESVKLPISPSAMNKSSPDSNGGTRKTSLYFVDFIVLAISILAITNSLMF